MKWINKKVSIIILIMNEYNYLKQCLDSIEKYTDNYELILILNGSGNKIKNYVHSLSYPDLIIIENKENMGFPYGINQGIKVAKHDLLLFLNNDTLVTPNWLRTLKKTFDEVGDAGIVGPYTSYAGSNGQQIDIMYYRRNVVEEEEINAFAKLLTKYDENLDRNKKYHPCSIIGFCLLVKKEVIDKIGVFDWHRWKLGNEEEVEFIWRANKLAGYKTYLCTTSYVHHFGRRGWSSIGYNQDKQENYNIEVRRDFRERKDTNYVYKFIKNDVEIPSLENTNLRKVKIAWVADFLIQDYIAGGAQYTNNIMIEEGKRRGYNIDVVTPSNPLSNNYDLYVLNNIRHFEGRFLLNIVNNKKYIKWEHDYWIVGTKRNNSPLTKMLDNSLLNLFMSKRQINECETKLGMKIPKADYVLSPIDTDMFFIDNNIRKDSNLAIWTGHDEPNNKGFDNLIEYANKNKKLNIKAFGKFSKYNNSNTPPNIDIMGEVPQVEFSEWLKKAKYVIALPNWVEPTGRSIMEGLLCGCTLIVNDNIGFLYEDIDIDNYEELKKAVHSENKFWDLIEGII